MEKLENIRATLISLSSMMGLRIDLFDRSGRCMQSIDGEGEQAHAEDWMAHLPELDLSQLSAPRFLNAAEGKGARMCLIPMGSHILVLSDAEKRQRESMLLASIKDSLPLIAKIVGGEGVIFDDDGVRLLNVDSNGGLNRHFNNRISQYALQAMQENRVVIGPSTSAPGAMAVRIPITKAFGLGFNNEQTVTQRIKLQEQINRDKTAKFTFEDIIGISGSIAAAKDLASKASNTNSTVLLVGETGTGKEVFAHAIHNASARSDKPFVAINCGAIPHSLIESTLFGYVKGAFTGANVEGGVGIFEQANGGTLSLDEISEMDFNLQARLLRVLEDREVVRIGGKNPIKVDVRIIASTNKDLEHLVQEGKFRHDLLFRLDVVRVNIPPLREHKEDILPLARFLIQQLNRILGTYVLHIEERAANAMVAYSWPGNVRELRNCIEVALNTVVGDTITITDLPYRLRANRDDVDEECSNHFSDDLTLRAVIEKAEKQYITRILNTVKGNHRKAAEVLGISTVTLWRKLQDG